MISLQGKRQRTPRRRQFIACYLKMDYFFSLATLIVILCSLLALYFNPKRYRNLNNRWKIREFSHHFLSCSFIQLLCLSHWFDGWYNFFSSLILSPCVHFIVSIQFFPHRCSHISRMNLLFRHNQQII